MKMVEAGPALHLVEKKRLWLYHERNCWTCVVLRASNGAHDSDLWPRTQTNPSGNCATTESCRRRRWLNQLYKWVYQNRRWRFTIVGCGLGGW